MTVDNTIAKQETLAEKVMEANSLNSYSSPNRSKEKTDKMKELEIDKQTSSFHEHERLDTDPNPTQEAIVNEILRESQALLYQEPVAMESKRIRLQAEKDKSVKAPLTHTNTNEISFADDND